MGREGGVVVSDGRCARGVGMGWVRAFLFRLLLFVYVVCTQQLGERRWMSADAKQRGIGVYRACMFVRTRVHGMRDGARVLRFARSQRLVGHLTANKVDTCKAMINTSRTPTR